MTGWFQTCFIFTPKIGEDEPILANIFQMDWFNHQPDIPQIATKKTLFLEEFFLKLGVWGCMGLCFKSMSGVVELTRFLRDFPYNSALFGLVI